VLNCVPDALARGAMLRGLRAHLRQGGLAFVMLPLRCVASSPFTTRQTFTDALAAAGLEARGPRSSSSPQPWNSLAPLSH
jgi:25S rRNA (adenine2142-N1)-methyltransferase